MDIRDILAVPDRPHFRQNAACGSDTLRARRKYEPGLVDRFGWSEHQSSFKPCWNRRWLIHCARFKLW